MGEWLPLLVMFVIFGSLVGVVRTAEKQRKSINEHTAESDSNTLTEQQRRYLESLRSRTKHTTKPTADTSHVDDSHGHIGKVESYDKIVGSLGDISDEGCESLDGVRLIADDVAYSTAEITTNFDREQLKKAIVLGEVLNNPRFKHPHGKK